MGRDSVLGLCALWVYRFNPRARMGRDLNPIAKTLTLGCFNPRARMGRDRVCLNKGHIFFCFNPRARMGRDVVDDWLLAV